MEMVTITRSCLQLNKVCLHHQSRKMYVQAPQKITSRVTKQYGFSSYETRRTFHLTDVRRKSDPSNQTHPKWRRPHLSTDHGIAEARASSPDSTSRRKDSLYAVFPAPLPCAPSRMIIHCSVLMCAPYLREKISDINFYRDSWQKKIYSGVESNSKSCVSHVQPIDPVYTQQAWSVTGTNH
jgi:hypothetical protein